jgi:hypothetical protein
MDPLQRFRRLVARELGARQGAARRYSAELRAAAVAYWRTREAAGDDLPAVSMALGVAPMTLRRWAQPDPFRPVQVVPDRVANTRVVVTVSTDGIRVEGLDIDGAVQLVARLR